MIKTPLAILLTLFLSLRSGQALLFNYECNQTLDDAPRDIFVPSFQDRIRINFTNSLSTQPISCSFHVTTNCTDCRITISARSIPLNVNANTLNCSNCNSSCSTVMVWDVFEVPLSRLVNKAYLSSGPTLTILMCNPGALVSSLVLVLQASQEAPSVQCGVNEAWGTVQSTGYPSYYYMPVYPNFSSTGGCSVTSFNSSSVVVTFNDFDLLDGDRVVFLSQSGATLFEFSTDQKPFESFFIHENFTVYFQVFPRKYWFERSRFIGFHLTWRAVDSSFDDDPDGKAKLISRRRFSREESLDGNVLILRANELVERIFLIDPIRLMNPGSATPGIVILMELQCRQALCSCFDVQLYRNVSAQSDIVGRLNENKHQFRRNFSAGIRLNVFTKCVNERMWLPEPVLKIIYAPYTRSRIPVGSKGSSCIFNSAEKNSGILCADSWCVPRIAACNSSLQSVCGPPSQCSQKSDHSTGPCDYYEFRCNSGLCISKLKLCDGVRDCEDGMDEARFVCFSDWVREKEMPPSISKPDDDDDDDDKNENPYNSQITFKIAFPVLVLLLILLSAAVFAYARRMKRRNARRAEASQLHQMANLAITSGNLFDYPPPPPSYEEAVQSPPSNIKPEAPTPPPEDLPTYESVIDESNHSSTSQPR